jgi:hypothetical protein
VLGFLLVSCSTYCVSTVFKARKVYHAIDAGEGGTSAAVSVRIKLLFGKNVTTTLEE